MIRMFVAGAIVISSPAMAADVPTRPPASAWTALQGESDALHGVWLVDAASGKVYRCSQYAGTAVCIEAKKMTADEWSRLSAATPQSR
jgi:hypothetical protein